MSFSVTHETEKYGQIVVMKDLDDEGAPAVKLYFEPPHLGTCSFALSFSDDDQGDAYREAAFEKLHDPERVSSLMDSSSVVRTVYEDAEVH